MSAPCQNSETSGHEHEMDGAVSCGASQLATPADRSSLSSLIGRIADEFTEALNRGQHPQIEDYTARYPQIAAVLEQVLRTLACLREPTNQYTGAAPTTADADGAAGYGSLVRGTWSAGASLAGETPTIPLGDFRVLRQIGRGGMGIVYEAEQLSLGRRVALKVLPLVGMLDERTLTRFRNEARAAATLNHPNIVPIIGSGEQGGVYYYAMQLIRGCTIADYIEELKGETTARESEAPAELAQPQIGSAGASPSHSASASRVAAFADTQPIAPSPTLPMAPSPAPGTKAYFCRVAEIGIQIAEALDHAHARGIVHRDIKPSNLLLDETGKVWVTDFGLAAIEGSPQLTMTGDILGTLRYMSPEQALGRTTILDQRTDIYSLGATLYELLTLRPAIEATQRASVLYRIANEEPIAPRQINLAVPRQLELITLKCLAKVPAQRYATPSELVADLQSYLRDEPIVARPPSFVRRTRAWLYRHRSIVLAVVAALCGCLIGALSIQVSIKDKTGKEIARIEVPDGGSVTVESSNGTVGNALRGVPQPSSAPASNVSDELNAFVLLGGPAIAERRFNTLLEAVQASSDGDTIEIRSNGPFFSDSVQNYHAVTVRAASGFRPIVHFSHGGPRERSNLFMGRAPLVLEGLDLKLVGADGDADVRQRLINSHDAPLYLANCRLTWNGTSQGIVLNSPKCKLTNCELLAKDGVMILEPRNSSLLEIDNCLFAGAHLTIRYAQRGLSGIRVDVKGTTWATEFCSFQVQLSFLPVLAGEPNAVPISLNVSRSVLSAPRCVLKFNQITSPRHTNLMPLDEAEQFLPRFIRWRGERVAYSRRENLLLYTVDDKNLGDTIPQLRQWQRFWSSSESGSIVQSVRFQGGDLLARAATAPETITPDDFRLRPDSAGYRAGPNGKDLGADIDFVGPGAAYERWKKIAAYQEWLSATAVKR